MATLTFNRPLGTFKDAVRAYREYKKDWQEQINKKLDRMEEEIQQAKADSFYKMDAV